MPVAYHHHRGAMSLEAGHELAHYEILEQIGQGGMGEVYRARDTKLDRDVAIKILPEEFANDDERLARFEREAKLLASLNHPNIASIYGLAKALEGEAPNGADSGLSQSPTLTRQGTQIGVILGTAAYMSPEQAKGKRVDERADIWAFGVVLFEMLAGEKVYSGETVSETLAAVIKDEPDWASLARQCPAHVRALLDRCLTKDPKLRLQHIGEARIALGRSSASFEAPAQTLRVNQSSLGTRILWLVTAAALGGALVAWLTRESADRPLPLWSSLTFEEGAGPGMGTGRNMALSPDGAKLAYITSPSADGGRLWVRDLADGSTEAITETEGAERPFWSPDGSMLGYFAEQELRVVPAKGGPSIVLAPAPNPSGGTWNDRDVILYNPAGGSLFRIPATGGTPTPVTQLSRPGEQHRSPVFLPDGRSFLFWTIDLAKDNDDDIYKGDLETGSIELIRTGGDPTYVEPGFLVYRVGYGIDVAASVFAQRFDPERAALSGQPLPVLSNLEIGDGGNGAFSVTTRTFVAAQSKQELLEAMPTLMSRKGDLQGTLDHREATWAPRFSHDGTQVAFAGKELWVHDLARNISELVPTEVTYPFSFAWSPDDTRIVYSTTRVRGQLRVVSVTGTANEEVMFQSDAGDIESPEWSPDGRTILFVYTPNETRTHRELWAFDLETDSASPISDGSFNIFGARFAPNGRFVAYSSDEGGGNSDVYLRSFPDTSAKERVSAGGGARPAWRDDGKELFFIDGDGHLVAVQINVEGTLSVSPAERVTDDPVTPNPYSAFINFDSHPDGQQYLLEPDFDRSGISQLTILRDWVGMLDPRD